MGPSGTQLWAPGETAAAPEEEFALFKLGGGVGEMAGEHGWGGKQLLAEEGKQDAVEAEKTGKN